MKTKISMYFLIINVFSTNVYADLAAMKGWDLGGLFRILILNKYTWLALMTIFTLIAIGSVLKEKLKNKTSSFDEKDERRKTSIEKNNLEKDIQNLLKSFKRSPLPMLLISKTGDVLWENLKAIKLNSRNKVEFREVKNNDIFLLQDMKYSLLLHEKFAHSLHTLVHFIPENKIKNSEIRKDSLCLSETLLDVIESYNFIFQTSDIRVNFFEEDWDLKCFVGESKVIELMSSFLLATHVLVKDSPKVDTVDFILDRDQQRLSFSILIHDFAISDDLLHKEIEFRGEKTTLASTFKKCQKLMDDFSGRVFVNTLNNKGSTQSNCYISFSFNETRTDKVKPYQIRV